jgi:hypothetical protein
LSYTIGRHAQSISNHQAHLEGANAKWEGVVVCASMPNSASCHQWLHPWAFLCLDNSHYRYWPRLYSVDLVSEVESASCYYADTFKRLSRIPEGPSSTESRSVSSRCQRIYLCCCRLSSGVDLSTSIRPGQRKAEQAVH